MDIVKLLSGFEDSVEDAEETQRVEKEIQQMKSEPCPDPHGPVRVERLDARLFVELQISKTESRMWVPVEAISHIHQDEHYDRFHGRCQLEVNSHSGSVFPVRHTVDEIMDAIVRASS
jgi:hypothetical protein